MSNTTKALQIAIDVILVCLLISLIFRNYNLTAQLAKAENEAIYQNMLEYQSSDISALEGVRLNGSTVITAVKKYQSEMPVTVEVEGITRVFDSNNHFTNVLDSSGTVLINPDEVFTCEKEVNVNGIVTGLRFTKGGILSAAGTVRTYQSLFEDVVSAIDSVEDVTTTSDYSSLMAALGDLVNAKSGLASLVTKQAIEYRSETLAREAQSNLSTTRDNYYTAQSNYEASYTEIDKVFGYNSDVEVLSSGTRNKILMAFVEVDSGTGITQDTYFYYNGSWYSNKPGFDPTTFSGLAFVESGGKVFIHSGIGSGRCTIIVSNS